MEMPTRNFRVLAILTILAACIVGYVAYEGSQPPPNPIPTTKPLGPHPSPTKEVPHVTDMGPNLESPRVQGLPSAPFSVTSRRRADVPEADRVVMADTLRKIHASLGNAEFRGAKILYERVLPGKKHDKAFELPPMPKEAVEEAYAELSRGLRELTPDSPLTEKLKEQALREIASFTDRPKPFKVMSARIPENATEKIYVVEYCVDDPKAVMPDSDGRITITLGSKPGQTIVRDGYYVEGEGWVHKRYSHFFEEAPE